ncbi:GNAT family acetyltransferase [uncultured Pleomorphomonas sp.]|uniref:GNAT family acetyltransferase n=1 Tax=uncultured Pleomorphomonas sp. TaxID=442121 RepID=A0A212LAV9_9HYPH|nr:GNAT family N-acetyltransferase [uncultured Pleomorphomonas sp.]SCM74665.1 GNAT family acetyltransferase [uncultured Pleomorphomonas sp.]
MILATPRLVLAPWTERDLAPFAALNADPEVMRYFPKTMTAEESDALVGRLRGMWAEHGYGLSAVRRREDDAFIGMVGIQKVLNPAYPFAPAVEVGWRLAKAFWRQGYAGEAARAALAHGFDVLELAEIVAFTAVANLPSRAVMASLGMARDPADDFLHPLLPEDHPLRPHVLYRLKREDFRR